MPGQRAQQVIRAHRVDAQDVGRLRERLALMGRAGEVVDVVGRRRRRSPRSPRRRRAGRRRARRCARRRGRRRMPAGAVPGDDARRGDGRVRRQQPIEQVAGGEAGAAGDEDAGTALARGHAGRSERRVRSAVLRLVVGLEGGVLFLDRAPPPLVLAVPGDRLRRRPSSKSCDRRPAQRLQLRGVERIAAIVARADPRPAGSASGPADELEQAVGEVDVLHLVAAADVVDLAGLALRSSSRSTPRQWSSTCSQSRTFWPSP